MFRQPDFFSDVLILSSVNCCLLPIIFDMHCCLPLLIFQYALLLAPCFKMCQVQNVKQNHLSVDVSVSQIDIGKSIYEI